MVLACWLSSVWPLSVLRPTRYSARLSTLSIPGMLRSSTASCCSGAAGAMAAGAEGTAPVVVEAAVEREAETVVVLVMGRYGAEADAPEGKREQQLLWWRLQ